MKVEKLDRVALTVKNLDEAMRLFSGLFETTFRKSYDKIAKGEVKRRKTVTEHANRSFEETPLRAAVSPIGLELIETNPPTEKEGVRSFHLKVYDLEQAKAEMKEKGIHLLAEVEVGDVKEAIFSPDDLCGARLVLVEYEKAPWREV